MKVREVAASDAPVAVVLADMSMKASELSPIDNRARRILTHGGTFWRELMDVDAFRHLVETRHETVEFWAARRHDNPFAKPGETFVNWRPDHPHTTRAAVEEQEQIGIRRWTDDGGQPVAEQIRLKANSLIVVADSVYEECETPCWTVEPSGEEIIVHLSLFGPKSEAARRAKEKTPNSLVRVSQRVPQIFSLERQADALACAREMGAAMQPQARQVRLTAKVRIMLPEALLLPDDCIALEQAAECVLNACQPHLNAVSRPAAMAWFALRDLMEAQGHSASLRLAAQVERMARTWKDAIRTGAGAAEDRWVYGEHYMTFQAPRSHGIGNRPPIEDAIANCGLATHRWKRRPVDGREWVHLGQDLPPLPQDPTGIVVSEILTLQEARTVAHALGANLDDEAAAAADGRLRLLSVRDGSGPVAAVVLDRTGAVERTIGRWGRGASTHVAEKIQVYARAMTDAVLSASLSGATSTDPSARYA